MVLAASDNPKTAVELVQPPAGTPVGTRVFLEGESELMLSLAAPAQVNSKKKNSAWVKIAPELATNAEGIACFGGKPICTPQGNCFAANMKNGPIS